MEKEGFYTIELEQLLQNSNLESDVALLADVEAELAMKAIE